MDRIEINVQSGDVAVISLSQEEIDNIRRAEQEYLSGITYADKRRAEYPTFEQQMDILYHEGYEGWKSVITAIKEKYPKL